MADIPSPTKKPTRAFEPAPVEPSDPRGSLQREASTEWNAQIVAKAMDARRNIQRGQLGMPPPTGNRRPLQATQSAPVLSFGTHIPTTTEISQAVYGTKRMNELPPMAEHSFYDNQERSRRSASQRSLGEGGSGLFSGGSFTSGYATTAEAGNEEAMGGNDGDGFDLDEAFGERKIQFPPSAFGGLEDSQGSNSTSRTITQGLKRAFDDGQQGETGAEDDDEMMAGGTDVEDEGEDTAVALKAPTGRKIGGRRGLSKTTSLPAHLFSNPEF